MATPITPNQAQPSKNASGKSDAPVTNRDAGAPLRDGVKDGAKDAPKAEMKDSSTDSAKPAVFDPKAQDTAKKI